MKILICFSFAINSRAVFGKKNQIPPDFTFKSGGFRQKKSNSAQFRFFHYQYSFSVSGVLDGSPTEQITAFTQALRKIGYQGDMPQSWMNAFFILSELLETRLSENQRCTIFIDELPCFDTPRSGFIQAFSHFWNTWGQKHPQVLLIVCGSATTWMIKNIIDSHGGLHNRITHEIHLRPFTLNETERNGYVWHTFHKSKDVWVSTG